MIIEFNNYDDGTFYFHYITDEVRISTNGVDSLMYELRDYSQHEIADLHLYDEPDDDIYFQLSTLTDYVDDIIKAVHILNFLLKEA